MARNLRRELDEFAHSQDKKIGMLSFSKEWSSPVLWSHHAAGHKGICLGFEIKRTLGVRGVEVVRYDDSKLQAVADKPNLARIPDALRELLFVTKYSHWSYEQEMRVFVKLEHATKENGMYFYPLSDDLRLKEVILGHLCPTSLLGPIRKLVRALHPDAVVSKARLGFKYFEVKLDNRYPTE